MLSWKAKDGRKIILGIRIGDDNMKLLDKICVVIGSIVAILAFITLPYIAVCFIWYNICWCFGIQVSAKVALGILLTIYTLKYIFSKE